VPVCEVLFDGWAYRNVGIGTAISRFWTSVGREATFNPD
jgi:hypothetical protein